MPGPAPKPIEIRQRRNVSATRTTLQATQMARTKAPSMPKLPEGEKYHPMARKWWKDVWSSPMAAEYLDADIHGLARLLMLVNAYWWEPSVKLAAEIRLQQQNYGLTPLDRRRLEWQIEQVEDAQDKRERRRVRHATVINGDDPRDVLR